MSYQSLYQWFYPQYIKSCSLIKKFFLNKWTPFYILGVNLIIIFVKRVKHTKKFKNHWLSQSKWWEQNYWPIQLRRGCWVATGLSQWMGCSDLQGYGCGRESINPAKMKLFPSCHNPFASSKIYKLFTVFFAFGWWLVWYSWDPICRDVAFEFLCSPEVICGLLGNTCCSCKTKEHQQQRENQISKIHKQTTNHENQIINTQTNKIIKT